jgi:hypothetical protein
MSRSLLAAGVAAVALAAGGTVVGTQLAASDPAPVGTKMCDGIDLFLTDGECFAASVIRFVSLYNMQGAAQFCNWKKANPGEWSRLKAYAETNGQPANIVTWFGGHIKNDLEAYFATGAGVFIIEPNISPNICKTPLAPPVVTGVTPSETDVTVTVTTTP